MITFCFIIAFSSGIVLTSPANVSSTDSGFGCAVALISWLNPDLLPTRGDLYWFVIAISHANNESHESSGTVHIIHLPAALCPSVATDPDFSRHHDGSEFWQFEFRLRTSYLAGIADKFRLARAATATATTTATAATAAGYSRASATDMDNQQW